MKQILEPLTTSALTNMEAGQLFRRHLGDLSTIDASLLVDVPFNNYVQQIGNQAAVYENALDTIALNDIRMIRGKVFGNADRKILGVGLAVAALPLFYFSALMAVYTGGSPILAILPPAGFLIGGIRLSGARRFKATNNWKFKVIQQ